MTDVEEIYHLVEAAHRNSARVGTMSRSELLVCALVLERPDLMQGWTNLVAAS